ncbi:MAG: hypothetical protein KGO05_15170, partial [Chloroflexota bacterium]|nr:hypothetical protein [Chloroflexota bacterium]
MSMDDTTVPFPSESGAAPDMSAGLAGASAWDSAWDAMTVSDAPTRVLPRQVTSAPRDSLDYSRKLRRRMTSRPRRRLPEGRGPLIAAVSMGLLLILGIPLLVALAGAAHDYTTLKGLGESGMAHLLAVKSDLSGQPASGSGASSASSSSSLSALGGSGKTAGLLATLEELLATPGPNVTDPAYTYLAQRQGGTFNPLTVTIHPAKGVSAEGTKTATFTTTLAGPTYFALGGKPKPTPTPVPAASATPATTPTTTSGGTGSSKTSIFPDPQRIAAAEADLRAAQRDFQSLADRLDHPDATL